MKPPIFKQNDRVKLKKEVVEQLPDVGIKFDLLKLLDQPLLIINIVEILDTRFYKVQECGWAILENELEFISFLPTQKDCDCPVTTIFNRGCQNKDHF